MTEPLGSVGSLDRRLLADPGDVADVVAALRLTDPDEIRLLRCVVGNLMAYRAETGFYGTVRIDADVDPDLYRLLEKLVRHKYLRLRFVPPEGGAS